MQTKPFLNIKKTSVRNKAQELGMIIDEEFLDEYTTIVNESLKVRNIHFKKKKLEK